jgi:hypothetical protein
LIFQEKLLYNIVKYKAFMTLWFKGCYKQPIVRREKIDTIRPTSCRCQPGDIVNFSVGPRPAFARAEILTREDIRLADLAPERRAQVEKLYAVDGDFCRLTFRLLQ